MQRLERLKGRALGFRCDFRLSLRLTQQYKETINMTTLSYIFAEPALRSPVDEWQPHGKRDRSRPPRGGSLTALLQISPKSTSSLVSLPSISQERRPVRHPAGLPSHQRQPRAWSDSRLPRTTSVSVISAGSRAHEADTLESRDNGRSLRLGRLQVLDGP